MPIMPWMIAASLVAEILLIVRVFRLGLQQSHKWFLVYLIYGVGMSLASGGIGTQSQLYCYMYWSSRPIDLVLKCLIVCELFWNLYERNRGLRWLAEGSLWAATFIGGVSATSVLYLSEQARAVCTGLDCFYARFLDLRAYLLTGLVVFMVVLLAQFRRMAEVDWNSTVHALILTVFLTSKTSIEVLRFFASEASRELIVALNIVMSVLHVLCVLLWCLLLKRHMAINAMRFRHPHSITSETVLQFTAMLRHIGDGAASTFMRHTAHLYEREKREGDLWHPTRLP